jgi:putative transposase
VENHLAGGQISRQEEWTQSIAVGSRPFVDNVKELLGFRAKSREIGGGAKGF